MKDGSCPAEPGGCLETLSRRPGFPLPAASVPEPPSLQKATAYMGLGLMPRRSLCPQLTSLQVRPSGVLSLLHKAEPRHQRQSSRLVKPVKPAIYCC